MSNLQFQDGSFIRVIFDHKQTSRGFEISADLQLLWDEFKSRTDKERYAKVTIPRYNNRKPLVKIGNCVVNEALPIGTVSLSASLYNVSLYVPQITVCKFKPVSSPQTLESITFLLNSELYDKVIGSLTKSEVIEFVLRKFNILVGTTPLENEENLSKCICKVINTRPCNIGLINLDETQISIVRDDSGLLQDSMISTVIKIPKSTVSLKCLKYPVAKELLPGFLEPDENLTTDEDDDLYAFAGFKLFEEAGITDGSRVTVYNDHHSMILKLFVLRQPNNLLQSTLYVHPRVFANFQISTYVNILKYSLDRKHIPVATSVSIARVGNYIQTQRKYEEIILSNLKHYLTSKIRILRKDELIPIAFDSKYTPLLIPELDNNITGKYYDKLVWFSIESISFQENGDIGNLDSDQRLFTIDPLKTKLVTENIVSKNPLIINNESYISYFGLNSNFKYDYNIFTYANKLKDILNVSQNCIERKLAINTKILLYSLTPGTGKSTLVNSLALDLGFELLEMDCMNLINSNLVGSLSSVSKTVGFLKAKFESFLNYSLPAIIFLTHIDILLQKGDPNQESQSANAYQIMDIEFSSLLNILQKQFPSTIFIFSTNSLDSLPRNFISKINFEIEVQVPQESERREIFKWYLSSDQINKIKLEELEFKVSNNLNLNNIALKSAGLLPADLKYVIDNSKHRAFERFTSSVRDDCVLIDVNDIDSAINDVRGEYAVSIGAPKIPKVTWDDIGGVDMVKGEIMDTIDMPMKYPELFASGMKKRSGILFYGPPGTGKTLMAKAIATNFSLNFFSVKGPELLNMYIGESEANVRRVFQKARDAKPCVIFFDELDSVAPKRGNQGDSGGVMDRIVSQLLAELDGMGTNGDGVYVIGATNRPDLLDEALLRPGRFDKLLYLGIPDTNEKQLNILQALTRTFKLSSECDLKKIAELSPFNYSGADFYGLCSDAMLNAMTRTASEVDKKLDQYNAVNVEKISLRYWFDNIAQEEDLEVVVKLSDFVKAQRQLVPSVSEEELKHYVRVKAQFES
ncbi:hypothetical protein TPHA_0P01580 [Tetrapisispora phaffii CBS 4417]|uniref:Peroxisomal ATPase PEX6 n=1 Tax=Tetrapisispora phaffii (strain ATCC 24235 / CBS 4417 / NBRC 1672 / NRRL Y-8282 / UCD 70-5) TaxID=1071381 RepID=G8C2D8_TETPH|nr:hypothetical protein TPHA_0P01580 [Tetrapisispora phaffii CBS 4417]CCE66316.1 hypothetical protein TPHA_0P01580 [Tetrapisispora phaffii CBS 4417]